MMLFRPTADESAAIAAAAKLTLDGEDWTHAAKVYAPGLWAIWWDAPDGGCGWF